LCQGEQGRLKSRLIVCPYHAWSYATDGRLVRVPSRALPAGFDQGGYGLYAVSVSEWRGFVFVNLDPEPAAQAAESFDTGSADLGNWPLEELVVGHSYGKIVACNWKIFWENFNECLHCPGVHRELSSMVPIYGRGMMTRHDDPEWALHADNDDPRHSGGLRQGAETWSRDGRAHGPTFAGLTEAERKAGQTYATHLPSMFVVGHIDYVRWVRLKPLSPETTELVAEWLFSPEALASRGFDLDNIVSFGARVLDEDAAICEVNQRGLRARPFAAGVLMPEEYDILRFHDWVRSQAG
jgi:Rieske 2Fe-2S family protein